MHRLTVSLHCTEVSERLLTVFAFEVVDPCMTRQVLLEVRQTREAFLAVATVVLVDTLVRGHVIGVTLTGFELTPAQMALQQALIVEGWFIVAMMGDLKCTEKRTQLVRLLI